MTRAVLGLAATIALSACGTMQSTGTAARPLLTDKEVANFTVDKYFAVSGMLAAPKSDPWKPVTIDVSNVKPDFVVGAGGTHGTVQKAVNAAMVQGGKARIYIKVLPGVYSEAVYVPINAPQITLYGAGVSPEKVTIQLKLDAMFLPEAYTKAVNPSGQFVQGDPAWNMYNVCATLPANKAIDTPCAAVVWAQSEGFQLKNLTIVNTLLDSVDAKTHQAVALRTDGDKTQLENVFLISRQDTLLVNVGEAPTQQNKIGTYPTDRIARAYIKDSYIEGDTDFVFGRANAVFDNCQFHTVSTRKPLSAAPGVVFAPDTLPNNSYGFLVINSRLTADKGYAVAGAPKANLGRSWDQGASKGYVPGQSPSGQLLIRDSQISAAYSAIAPWGEAATSKRPFTANIAPERKLDDPAFNRLWEYNNKMLP